MRVLERAACFLACQSCRPFMRVRYNIVICSDASLLVIGVLANVHGTANVRGKCTPLAFAVRAYSNSACLAPTVHILASRTLMTFICMLAVNRCGTSYSNALGQCVKCPNGIDGDCGAGETCYGQMPDCSGTATLLWTLRAVICSKLGRPELRRVLCTATHQVHRHQGS